jgi:hypothetical protein
VGDKSESVTVGFKYFLGAHMGLVHGPVDSLNRIRVADKVAWVGAQTESGSIVIEQEELFGGDGGEGGISGTFTFANGDPLQIQSTYLLGVLGTPLPAFRGVSCGIIEQMYVSSNNPYLKPWAFLMTRTDITTRGAEQWYVEKARIGLGGVSEGDPVLGSIALMLDDQESAATGTSNCPSQSWGNPLHRGSHNLKFPTTEEEYEALWVENTSEDDFLKTVEANARLAELWVEKYKPFADFSFTDDFGCYRTQTLHSPSIAAPASYDLIRVNVQAVNGDGCDGQGGSGATEICDAQFGGVTYILDIERPATARCPDMNPAHIIRECLTDKEWGMGYTDADIDDVSFTAAADTLYTEQMGISILWQRENTIEAFVQDIVRHIDAALYVDRRTGKFVLKLIRSEATPTLTLGSNNIERVENYKRPAFGDLVNSVTVIYDECDDGKLTGPTA